MVSPIFPEKSDDLFSEAPFNLSVMIYYSLERIHIPVREFNLITCPLT